MRQSTIRYGLNLIITAVVLVTLATFFHEVLAKALSLSRAAESRLIFWGLLWGASFGFAGIVVSVAGLLGQPDRGVPSRVAPRLLLLVAFILLFFYLFYSSFISPRPASVRPGETITI